MRVDKNNHELRADVTTRLPLFPSPSLQADQAERELIDVNNRLASAQHSNETLLTKLAESTRENSQLERVSVCLTSLAIRPCGWMCLALRTDSDGRATFAFLLCPAASPISHIPDPIRFVHRHPAC